MPPLARHDDVGVCEGVTVAVAVSVGVLDGVGVKEAVLDAGGMVVAQGLLTPETLVGVGAMLEEAFAEDDEDLDEELEDEA